LEFFQVYWQSIYREPANSASKPRFFSQKGAWTGFISGFIFWFAFGFFVYGLLGGVILGVVLGLVDAAAGGVSRFIFWLVNNLPNRVLGAIGLVLILIASFLQFASPLIELLNITGK